MTINTPAWVRGSVFYEIFPDRFARTLREDDPPWDEAALEPWDVTPRGRAHKGGDLDGATAKLAWLADLGVNAIYLAPIFVSPTSHRYKPVDHFHVDPLLGGDAAFDRFLEEAHRRRMRVVLDAVFGHVGLGFARFQDVLEYGARSPWRRWFRIERFPLNPWDTSRPANYHGWDGNRTMPQLNHDNPHVREFLFEVAEHWVRRGIDGWRFDAPETIPVPGFWQAMRARLRELNPEVYLVGENWTDPSRWLDGTQWHGAMNYPLGGLIRWFAAHAHLRPEHLHAAARPEGLLGGARFAHQVELLVARHPWEIALAQLNLLNSHDLARFLTVAGDDRRSVELATVLLFTLPGAPCIFYGDEVGLAGGMPPDCRRGFPDPERWDLRLLALHRELIGLRRSSAVLAEGRHRTIAAAGFAVAYERRLEAERVLVAVNAGDGPSALPVALAPFERALLRVGDADVSGGRLSLGPRSAVVVGSS